jgi:hypothetical protein
MDQNEINRLSLGTFAERDKPAIYPQKFWTELKDSKDPANPIKIDMVECVKRGAPGTTIIYRISKVKEDPLFWAVIGPSYDAWIKGNQEPEDGTPLSAWPGIRSMEADRLRSMMIRTVQDVAAMTEADMDRCNIMGIRTIREKAIAFLGASDQQKAAVDLLDAKAEIAALKKAHEEAMDAIRYLKSRLPVEDKMETAPPVVPETRGPGRPKKVA